MSPTTKSTAYFGLGMSVGLAMAFFITTYSSLTFNRNKIIGPATYRDIKSKGLGAGMAKDIDKDREIMDNSILFRGETSWNSKNGKDPSRTLQSVHSHEELDAMGGPKHQLHFNDSHVHNDNSTLADVLYKKVRVLCWVLTAPQNLEKKAQHVRATWAKRCNKLLFMSSTTNHSFPTIGLNISEGREHLTAKTMRAYDYIAERHIDEADWFMKADDDTYVILENLRYFLSGVDTNTPVFYGHLFNTIVKQGYFSGGGGYVLSKEALRRFHARDNKFCRSDGGAEDVEIGRCMESLGVKTGLSLDSLGRSRFHCFDPETHLSGGYPDWYYKYDAYGAQKGMASISDYAISFHYVPPKKMYSLEFYVYHLRPYGLMSQEQHLNNPPNATAMPR